MRYLASQGLFLLLTFLGLLSLFHPSWRPVFALALCLIIVAHVCYSLIVNDSLLSPQVPAAFLRLLASIATWLYITSKLIVAQAVRLFGFGRAFWRQKVLVTMKRFWNRYQLSTDVDDTERSHRDANVQYDENKRMSRSFNYGDALGLTSTPLVTQKDIKNGGLSYNAKRDSMFGDSNNGSLKEESRLYSAESSPWSATNSPRMRPRASGIKTVQTVAGPLLASTRYNIDPKVYFDVTSPGLTSRLTKYASEPNKLTHQSRYAAGQFPKVNLHASPVPLIKPIKKTTPVTVRVAQPVASKLTNTQKKAFRSQMNEKKSTNMYEALKEISLKRHASRDDVSDLVKKQRTEMSYQDELGNLEEMTQKRARDDSPKSDEDLSSDYKSLRPKKRTKTPSCNDIINSLSSSIHVFSGTKRKAEDNSREVEKHFKSQDVSQQSTSAKDNQQSLDVSMCTANESVDSSRNSSVQEEDNFLRKAKSPQPAKLSDKLFMGAEPEKNEKLQALIEEQGNVNPKFSLDDKDEIRREDITLMRQTSMKARLQSMFDAISGKSNKINPDVVIHAEEIGKEASVSAQVATTPVANIPTQASVIAPILKSQVEKPATPKHVTFNLSTASKPAATNNTAPTFKAASIPSKLTATPAPEVPKLDLSTSTSSSVTVPKFNFGSVTATSTAVSSAVTPTVTKTVSLDSKTPPTTTVSFAVPTIAPTLTASAATGYTPSFGGGVAAATSSTSTIATSSTAKGPAYGTCTTPSFSFGKSQSSPISGENKMIFGSAPSTATEAVKPTFSFGQGAPAIPSVKLNFGQSTATTTSATLSFGQPTAVVSESKPATQPLVTTSSTPIMSFGQTNPLTTTSATFSFGQSSAAATTSAPTLKFNSTTSSGPILSFGQAAKTTSSTILNFGQQTTTVSSPATMSFGQQSSTSTGSTLFGAAKPTPVESSKPTFGTVATTTSAGAFNTPNFVFGGAAPSNSFAQGKTFTAKTTSSSSFIVTPSFTSTTTTTAPTNIFNTTTPATTSASIFGSSSAPSTTTSSSIFSASAFKFGSSTNPPAFGATATTSAPPAFGTATPTAAPPAFGTANAAPIFGATTAAPAPSFGSVVNTTTASSFGTNTFGSGAPPAYGASVTTFSASKPTAPPSFGATAVAPSFGAATPATVPSFGATTATTTPSFGATTTTAAPSFGAASATSTPSFGTTSATPAPAFGAASATPAPAFGASSTSTAATPAFGSTAAPAFGAQANPPPAFGAATTPNLNFGATSNGFRSTPTQSPFGGAPMQNPSFGGATAATPATNFPNGNFSFSGSNAPQPAAQPAAQSGFNFNNTSNNTGGAGGVFQFGAGASKPGGGFNFNAPTGAPNVSFGATPAAFGGTPQTPGTNFGTPSQGGNMFSIGTGSTARPRTARDRLRRR